MTTTVDLIRGKIAKVLNSREVALNVGKQQGVEIGMKFQILSRSGLDIPDPDTGDILGSIDLPKARVKVINVYDKVAVASTYRTETVNVGGRFGPDIRLLFQPPRWETRPETLKIKTTAEQDHMESGDSDSYVSTGDPVVQVIDGED